MVSLADAQSSIRYLLVELCQDLVRLRLNRIYCIELIVRAVNRYINHEKKKEQLLGGAQAIKLLSRSLKRTGNSSRISTTK